MSSICSDTSEEADHDERHPRYSRHASLILYGLWPALMQHRRIRSFGDSIHEFVGKHTRNDRVTSLESEGTVTPPPSYASTEHEHIFSEDQPSISRWMADTTPARPLSSGSTTPTYVGESQDSAQETGSGIQWRYARPGFASLTLAQSEDTQELGSNPLFARRQYLSGLACLLHGLPTDLSEEEMTNLHESLPLALKLAQTTENQLAIRPATAREPGPTQRSPQQSSFQHFVAVCTMYLFLAASFVLPYVQYMLREAYQFDRRHKISDKVLSSSIDTAVAVRRNTITIAAQVCSMNDGKVGEQLKDASLYLVQGLSGGVYDGIGEGMQVLGLRTNKDR